MKHTTPDSMKFKRLCRRLQISPVVAAGTLELLWIATARDAPPGDIGRFTNEDIAIQVHWEGDADELVGALVDTGWLDTHQKYRLVVHDWHEHAPRYVHAWMKSKGLTFASYSSIEPTIDAPIGKPVEPPIEATVEGCIPNLTLPNQTIPKEEGGESDKSDPPADKVSVGEVVLEEWNRQMGQTCRWTKKRQVAFRERWKNQSWRTSWLEAVGRAAASRFCRGENDRGWLADFEWFLKPDTVTKLLEGKYDDRERKQTGKTFAQQSQTNVAALLAKAAADDAAAGRAAAMAGFLGGSDGK